MQHEKEASGCDNVFFKDESRIKPSTFQRAQNRKKYKDSFQLNELWEGLNYNIL